MKSSTGFTRPGILTLSNAATRRLLLAALWLFSALNSPAQPAAPTSPPSEADAAWAQVVEAARPLRPPAAWAHQAPNREERDKFHAERRDRAVAWSELAARFYHRFPRHPQSQAARLMHLTALQTAWGLGAKTQVEDLGATENQLAAPELDEDQKFNLRWDQAVRAAVSQSSSGKDAVNAELEKAARALWKDFPQRPEPGELLLLAAYQSPPTEGARLALEIAQRPGSTRAKQAAQQLLAKLTARIKAVDMELTTIEGKRIPLRSLKGKLVLLHFWHSAAGKRQGHLASIKQAVETHRGERLEVIGINFDPSDKLLREAVQRGEISWPQVWHVPSPSTTAPWREYGLNTLPAVWLLDRNGVLIDDQATGDLAKRIETLLGKP